MARVRFDCRQRLHQTPVVERPGRIAVNHQRRAARHLRPDSASDIRTHIQKMTVARDSQRANFANPVTGSDFGTDSQRSWIGCRGLAHQKSQMPLVQRERTGWILQAGWPVSLSLLDGLASR